MSGRVPTQPPIRRRIAKYLLVLGLLSGSAAIGSAQKPDDSLDDRPPLPPGESTRPMLAEKYRIPNQDRAIFRGIFDPKTGRRTEGVVDFRPVARESENKFEYDAWHEVTLHAAQFSAAELEEHASRDLTRDDLIGPTRFTFRLDLIRFDGKLTKVRRLPATRSLRDAGNKEIVEVYEALVVPLDESPVDPISIVVLELPKELEAVKQTPETQWMPVDQWAVAAGYFFKVKQDAPGDKPIPLLIGKSVRVPDGPPLAPDPKNPAAIDKSLRVFKYIRNGAPIAGGSENREEAAAWNRVLLHARRFSPEELEGYARTDLSFYDLFHDGRWVDKSGRVRYDGERDYKLELVRFEGRLISLKRMEPSPQMRDAGIESAFEGWLLPRDEPGVNPVCIVFTDPLEGVEPVGRVNTWVSFAGYLFKLMMYESGEKTKDDPSRNQWKRAPLLLGRAAIIRPDPEASSAISWQSFATIATAVVGALIASALLMAWWYRRGDRAARREIEANRSRNPFGADVVD